MSAVRGRKNNSKLIISMGIAIISMLILVGIIAAILFYNHWLSKDLSGNWMREVEVSSYFYEGYGDFFIEDEPQDRIKLKLPVHMQLVLLEDETQQGRYSRTQWIEEADYKAAKDIYVNMMIDRIIADTEKQAADGGVKLPQDVSTLETIEKILGMSVEDFLDVSYPWGSASFEALSEELSYEDIVTDTDMDKEGSLLIIHGETDELYRRDN